MHDLDRTQLESEFEQEYGNEEFEFESESFETEYEEPLSEEEEMEMATELLEVTDESELDQFLGSLFKKVGRTLKKAVKSPLGRMLKGVIKKALPIAGGAIGTYFAPGIGTAIGSKLGSAAGSMFELELEGLSPEDQEFEVAKRIVRLANSAVQKAASVPVTGSPVKAAQNALARAARIHAPGLVGGYNRYRSSSGGTGSGRWYRRGNKIILIGA